jgi:hypothetical protein
MLQRLNSLALSRSRFAVVIFCRPSKFMGPDDLTLVLQTWPASVSGRNVIHWAQMINDDVLALKRFDFGTNCANRTRYFETCNQAAYGSLSPPVYDLGAITVPQALFVGEIDLMCGRGLCLRGKRCMHTTYCGNPGGSSRDCCTMWETEGPT